jgi:uncharacterized protein (TIGR00375 family)
MNTYFADMHVHIGSAANGLPVKITAAKSLTVENIMEECMKRKGIDIVGIVDTSSPRVQADLEGLLKAEHLKELAAGGLCYKDKVTLILGAEAETTELIAADSGQIKARNAHCLCYFPGLAEIKEFTRELSRTGRTKNLDLSSQKCNLRMQELWALVKEIGGILIPAHAFTPHKGVYGSCVKSMREILTEQTWQEIPAVELGLSSDSEYADMISELAGKTFLTNSDAHSLPKIAREYNVIQMEELNFAEWLKALRRIEGRHVSGNFGFDPRLGKYNRTYCEDCGFTALDNPPITGCAVCGQKVDGRKVVMGVYDRICMIRDSSSPNHPAHRPDYQHQIPLQNLPGLGGKTLAILLEKHTEMEILHFISKAELEKLAGAKIAELIFLAREGKLEISAGGGGKYGRVTGRKDE